MIAFFCCWCSLKAYKYGLFSTHLSRRYLWLKSKYAQFFLSSEERKHLFILLFLQLLNWSSRIWTQASAYCFNKICIFWQNFRQVTWIILPRATKFLYAIIYGCALLFIIFYLSVIYFIAPLGAVIFTGLTLFGVIYTLISGFVYFSTRTSFGRYTDISQRFWKRSFSVFWLIELGLFACIVYLMFTSPNEVMYSYDTPRVFKTHFFAIEDFIFRAVIFNIILLLISNMLHISSRGRFELLCFYHFLVAFFFLLLLYVEIGIFQNYMSYIGYYKWLVSNETYDSLLDSEMMRSRTVHGFVFLAAITKFWHFILIAVLWFFFLGRHCESAETREGLLNASFQSFLILYGLNILTLAPHFKYLAHKYMTNPYYWFFEQPNFSALRVALAYTKCFYGF